MQLTLIENLADLGGLAAAFDAYRRTLGSKANDKDEVRRQDRQFFIGFARSWRSRYARSDADAGRHQRPCPVKLPHRHGSQYRRVYDAFDVLPGSACIWNPGRRGAHLVRQKVGDRCLVS